MLHVYRRGTAAALSRFAACLLTAPLLLFAQVEPGENIIANGRFDSDQMPLPPCWKLQLAPQEDCRCDASGGPGGIPCITFSNFGEKPKSFSLRQFELELVEGAKYRFSAKVRTKGLSGRNFGLAVVNHGWTKEIQVGKILPNQDWTEYSSEVMMIPSRPKNGYFAVFYALDFKGEFSVADVRLEAVDAAALAGSVKPSAGADTRLPRLVPVRPLLSRIPSTRREIVFSFYGRLPDKAEHHEFDIELSVPGVSSVSRKALCAGETAVPLPEGVDSGKATVRLARRSDGREVLSGEYRFCVVETPEHAVDSGRRLNNLVRELLSQDVEANDEDFDFSLAKDSWVFFSLGKVGARLLLDGVEAVGGDTPRGEAFRRVSAGRHTLKALSGRGARIIARKVPEIFNYPPCFNSFVLENGKYDWDFCEKFVFPATTIQNGGSIPRDRRQLHRRRGGEWLSSVGTSSIKSADDLYSRLAKSSGIVNPLFDGVTCDEQFFQNPGKLVHFTTGLKRFCLDDPGDRLVYSWAVGRPANLGVDHEFFSACANASRGRGRVLSEIYCRPTRTEAEARIYLDEYVKGTCTALAGLYPGAFDSIGVILANFNQIPILSIHLYPEVDLKYFLDMQLHLIANDPAFDGLGCVGYWGSYYADREFLRWSMAVLRHYCVEGRTDMLSGRYGYTYLPGHVSNGDFTDGLAGWTCSGDVLASGIKGLGRALESRWYADNGVGDSFALLRRTNGSISKIEQRLNGLVPGRLYSFQCCMFDEAAARNGVKCDRRVELDVAFSGAAPVEDLSWRHIDRRVTEKKPNPCINLEHVVFRAEAAEVTVCISNANAPEGSGLGVNFVSVCPYYSEGESMP